MSESRVKGVSKLPEAPIRWLCKVCNHVSDSCLTAPNPFDTDDIIVGCEECLQVDTLVYACWKCNNPGSIGTPKVAEYRYIHTCYKHQP